MSLPRSTAAYPLEFREALLAGASAPFTISHPNPHYLRLRLYGFIGALRNEKDPLADACVIRILPDNSGLTLSPRETHSDAVAIRTALREQNLTGPDDLFNRLTTAQE